ncbi:lipoprotein insertase outer membrane protein LolB [Legionella drozanskii]|uniref:Outer-membrane lipoprotein LolB n=1 Tax=Legionella drozanskii LLAP-1 TaxID=1212489 RepID=A0A0W0SY89_9GAMM|nr:lipoprotein insertase outer membrane protein LolB [Legionella drozanskii]KTC87909.1 molecular chaperone LolB [Legionella drozanskii LLAP-1]
MIAIRNIYIVSFLLLSACASRSVITEAPLNPITPATPEASAEATESTLSNQPLNNGKTLTELSTNEKGVADAQGKTAENKKGAKDASSTDKKQVSGASSGASRISSWDISGAMAARSKNKGWSATVNWVQRGASQYQIRLSGPLGSGTVLISRSGGVVTLRDGPKTASSSNAESLLKQQTGVSLPVSNLYYWVRGIPAPGSVQGEKRDAAGRLVQLRQGGYTIQYPQYSSAGGTSLPTTVRLQGNGIFIKMIIKSWRV